MKITGGFYKGYTESKKTAKKKEKKPKEDKRVVVLEEQPASTPRRLLWWIGKGLWMIFYIILFLLSSVGLTALVNEPIRSLLVAMIFGK